MKSRAQLRLHECTGPRAHSCLEAVGGARRALAAAQLNAFYKFTGNGQKAMEWKLFLSRLNCPQETISLFTLRAEKIHKRCSEKGRLVLL